MSKRAPKRSREGSSSSEASENNACQKRVNDRLDVRYNLPLLSRKVSLCPSFVTLPFRMIVSRVVRHFCKENDCADNDLDVSEDIFFATDC